MWARNCSRRLRFSSRSRSLACSDFFSPQAHLPQHLPHAALDYMHALTRQPFLQLGLGQVRLLPQPRAQLLLHRGMDATDRTVTPLHRSFLLTWGQLLPPDLLGKPPAHTKLYRQLPQASCSRLIPLQKLAPQIIRIGFRHCLGCTEFANPKLHHLCYLGYNYLSSALDCDSTILGWLARLPADRGARNCYWLAPRRIPFVLVRYTAGSMHRKITCERHFLSYSSGMHYELGSRLFNRFDRRPGVKGNSEFLSATRQARNQVGIEAFRALAVRDEG